MEDQSDIPEVNGGALVREQAALILSAEALGRSHTLERLFRFLLAATLEGRTPKELEIANEVFGRSAESIEQDASIRVHIHRLRKKLDEYYRGPGSAQAVRLTIPKADYRLVAERPVEPAMPEALPTARRPRVWLGVAGIMLALTAGGIGWLAGQKAGERNPALQRVRETALWSPVITSTKRVAIVVGDYYIFGQRNEGGEVVRLVREFDVNSARDLEGTGNPDDVDLGLHYLPVGIGNAVRSVTPILLANRGGGVPSFVVPSSQLSPELVKYTNLVYLGYLSGLGSLRDPTFSGSRFMIGNSYDEIVDRETGRTYSATTPLDSGPNTPAQDYAIVSTFKGVTGNTIVVIAGTRDAGLMQAAEFTSKTEELAKLDDLGSSANGFEALLAIESLEGVGLRARLIAWGPRLREADWSGRATQAFPDEPRAALMR